MALRDADRDLLEAGAREAAEAIMRLARRETGRMLSVDTERLEALCVRVAPRAVVVGFTVNGALEGRFALIIAEPGARALASDMIGAKQGHPPAEKLGRRATAALTELGNIAASAFLNGAAELLRASCVPSVPSFHVGDPAHLLPDALGGAHEALVVRLVIGDVDVEIALVR